jgi:TonB family protein
MQRPKVAVGVFILLCLLAVTLARTKEPSTSSFEPTTVVLSAEPVYPAMAMGSGTVVLAVGIDAAGEIQDVKVIKGSGGGFESSAREAIKEWKFKPAMLEGKPIPSVVTVAFSFSWPVVCGGGRGK